MRYIRHSLKKHLLAIPGVLACACAVAQAPGKASWPAVPSLLILPSEYGTLHIALNEYVHESTLQIDSRPTQPEIRGLLNITYAFQMPDAQAALVSINRGNDACPFSYRWVLLRRGSHLISPEFGSCSEKIRVSAEGKTLNIETPNRVDAAKIDVYSYDGDSTISYSTIDP